MSDDILSGISDKLSNVIGGDKPKPTKAKAPATMLVLHHSNGTLSESKTLRQYETDLAKIGYKGEVTSGTIAVQVKGSSTKKWSVYTFPIDVIGHATVECDGEILWDSRTDTAEQSPADEIKQQVEQMSDDELVDTVTAAIGPDAVEALLNASPEEQAAFDEQAQQQIEQLSEMLAEPKAPRSAKVQQRDEWWAEQQKTANLPAATDDGWDDDGKVHDAVVVNDDDDVDLAEADLGELAAIATKFHHKAEATLADSFHWATKSGQALLAAKALCKHGDWLPWLHANCPDMSVRSAQVYMKLARKALR